MFFSYKIKEDESHAKQFKRSFKLAPHTRFENRVHRSAVAQPVTSQDVKAPSMPPLPAASIQQMVQDDDAPIPIDVLRRALPSRFA